MAFSGDRAHCVRMATRRLRTLGLALATACGPGHSAETTGSSTAGAGSDGTTVTATAATTSPTGTATASGPATTDPGETGAPTTGATAVEPTTLSSSTSGTSTSGADPTSASTTELVPCEDTVGAPAETEAAPANVPECDVAQIDWHSEHPDCRVECSTITQIHGAGPLAGMPVVTQIAFGVAYSPCWSGLGLHRIRLGSLGKPQLDLYPALACGLDPWLGDHPLEGTLFDDTPFAVTLTIESYAGDWMSEDPSEPPRLLGSFSGDLVGPFEAIHCGGLDYTTNC
jgi:hypothetical protein